MSIQEDAFELFRIVSTSPHRTKVRDLVSKFSSSTRGYGNKLIPTPILGLLLYNQAGVKEFAGRAPVEELESWSDQERKILFGAHKQVLKLNQLCLNPLTVELPYCSNIANPYREYSSHVDSTGFEELLFRKEDAEKMALSFQRHPAFELALSNLKIVKENPLQIKYEQIVHELDSELIAAGPREDPDWIEKFTQAKKSNKPSDIFLRHVAALICLRDSLANLDQLIYQGLFQDKLLCLDQSDIVDYLGATTSSGSGIWLMFLLNKGTFLIHDTGDLILISTRPDRGLKNQLCRIEQQTIPLDLTRPFSTEVRTIDGNLNSYGALIR